MIDCQVKFCLSLHAEFLKLYIQNDTVMVAVKLSSFFFLSLRADFMSLQDDLCYALENG